MRKYAKMRSSVSVFVLSLLFILSGFLIACGGGGSGSSSGDVSISGRITAEQAVVAIQRTAKKDLFYAFSNFEIISRAHAQDTEATGDPLAGATVELYDAAGNLVATTITDENGEFEFLNVSPGDYSIIVSDPSIEPLTITGLTVLEGDTAEITGTVTVDGGEVSVDYVVDTCGLVADSPGQLGHAEALAEAAEISIDEVTALRETECLGWGVIAQMLDVHPGTLGLGNIRSSGGRPENVGGGRPDSAGPPDGVGGGRPDHAGPPDGVGGGRPDHAGPPASQSR